MGAKKKGEERLPCDVYCPNCGFPHQAKMTLKEYMRKKDQMPFRCRACGFTVFFSRVRVDTAKPHKDNRNTLKDVGEAVNIAAKVKTVAGLFG